MDPRPTRHPVARAQVTADDAGFVTIEYVVAIAISLVVLVVFANFVVSEYGLGVVRAAVDQGTRDGARTATPVTTCEASARQMIGDLLGTGPSSMGTAVSVSCQQTAGQLIATAQGSFRAWLPAIPPWRFSSTAQAILEPAG